MCPTAFFCVLSLGAALGLRYCLLIVAEVGNAGKGL